MFVENINDLRDSRGLTHGDSCPSWVANSVDHHFDSLQGMLSKEHREDPSCSDLDQSKGEEVECSSSSTERHVFMEGWVQVECSNMSIDGGEDDCGGIHLLSTTSNHTVHAIQAAHIPQLKLPTRYRAVDRVSQAH